MTLTITLSLGVASHVPPIVTGVQLYQAADEALLNAKHSGRNRVAVDSREQGGSIVLTAPLSSYPPSAPPPTVGSETSREPSS